MAGKKHNKKLPKDAVSAQDIEPLYGYVHGNWDALGGHQMSYINPAENDKFFTESFNASGSYTTTQYDSDDKEITTGLKPGESRNYVAGGASEQVDKHKDTNVEGTQRIEVGADQAAAYGRNQLLARKGQLVDVSGGHKALMTAKSSEVPVSIGHTGTVRQIDEKDNFHQVQGDHSVSVEKNFAQIINNEWGAYSGGNYDFYGDKKFHIFSKDAFIANTSSTMDFESQDKMNIKSSQEITIESDTTIILKVGSSKITISSSSIKIESSGAIDINGTATKLQGGGQVAPPTTFK